MVFLDAPPGWVQPISAFGLAEQQDSWGIFVRTLFVMAALLAVLPCHAAWDDQVILMSANGANCTFWQLSRASDLPRSSVQLDWALVDELALEAGGHEGIAIALDQWDPAKGTPTAGSKHYDRAAYCTIATRAPKAEAEKSEPPAAGKKGKDKSRAKPKPKAELAAKGANISEIACYRRNGPVRDKYVFGRSTREALRDGMVRYTHACTEGCERAPFQRLHELSIDDGPENPAHEKDLEAFYQVCVKR
jgi:hypothetical protein